MSTAPLTDPVVAPPIRVVVADADALARHALRAALSEGRGFHVDGEASDADTVLRSVAAWRPEVVIADAGLPETGGAIVVRRIMRDHPLTLVLLLAAVVEEAMALLALRAGAVGYLPKDMTPEALARTVAGVARRGQAGISRTATLTLVRDVQRRAVPDAGTARADRWLTPRQWQVLRLLPGGLQADEIARELGVSKDTARGHVNALVDRLGARDREDLVRIAGQLRRGSWAGITALGVGDLDEIAFGQWASKHAEHHLAT